MMARVYDKSIHVEHCWSLRNETTPLNERVCNELADYSSPIPLSWPISSHPYMVSFFSFENGSL